MQHRLLITIGFLFALGSSLTAQFTCDNSTVQQFATVMDEVKLIHAINSAPSCKFDLKPSAIKTLQASNPKITDAVISAMERKMEAAPPPTASAQSAAAAGELKQGVYLYLAANPSKPPLALTNEMPELKNGGFGKGNVVGSITGIGGGLWQKKKMRNELPGLESPVKIDDGNVFIVIKSISSMYRAKIALVRMEEHAGNRVASSYEGRLTMSKKAADPYGTPEWKGNDVEIRPGAALEPGHYGVIVGPAEVFAFDVTGAPAR